MPRLDGKAFFRELSDAVAEARQTGHFRDRRRGRHRRRKISRRERLPLAGEAVQARRSAADRERSPDATVRAEAATSSRPRRRATLATVSDLRRGPVRRGRGRQSSPRRWLVGQHDAVRRAAVRPAAAAASPSPSPASSRRTSMNALRISATCCGPISPSESRRRRMARACSCETRDSLTPISAPISFIVTSP